MPGDDKAGWASPPPPKEEEPPIAAPAWWKTSFGPGADSSELIVADETVREAIQRMMDETFLDVTTKDRRHGGGYGTKRLEVVQVLRNENPRVWREYAKQRRAVAKALGEEDLAETRTSAIEGLECLGEREKGCNEFLLFHGTRPSSCRAIADKDFLLRKAGTRAGTLYGSGIYFAECSSKSDEYAADDQTGPYVGLFAMLVSRVTLGRWLVCEEHFPNGAQLQAACTGPGASHHSVLGDREKIRGTYREFIIYDSAQAYPEYVVIYRRAAGGASAA